MRLSRIVLLVLGMSLAYSADNPFTGTWKLNVEKSKFNPGPASRSETVTISDDGKVSIEEIDSTGKPVSWSYTGVQGKEAPITGLGANSTVVETRTGNTIEHSWNFSGKPSTGKGVISKDGKTMTYRIKGTTEDGKPTNNVMIFEREQ